MHIEVNRDLDKFKESVVLGLSARQLIYSIIALALGSGIVLLVYPYVGLTIAAYIAVPVVAPIALTGFYSYHGMTFIEMMKLFTNEMKELKRPDEPLFKTPKTVQQTLDIQKVSENGIFQLSSTRYSKTYKFKDINYITSNHEEREDIIEEYCKLLPSFYYTFGGGNS